MRDSTAKVAFAAYLHDLGKFAERAKLDVPDSVLNTHIQMYCPQKIDNGKPLYYTHKHAAYTALAWDLLEQNVPDLIKGDMYPFAGRSSGEDKTDSLLNASAMHHKPETFLQWIIATADRVASGFEREKFENYNQSGDERAQQKTGKNHYQARLLTLFEQIDIHNQGLVTNDINQLQWCYPLKSLSVENIFPRKRLEAEPAQNEPAQAEYRKLWEQFIQCGISEIPQSHRKNWHLWLDHFDTLWQNYTQAIPSATAFSIKPEVSLYDHSKTTAALAAALWRWHEACGKTSASDASRLRDRSDWDEQKILLIQGDFFGIQNFIFASGNQTNKRAAKLLRGRSFQVSLFAELAALKILEACELPPTSQVLNAAGKFMIVAPNTDDVKLALEEVHREISDWFLQHTYGQVGLGLAYQEASCNDFVDKKRFAALVKKSFAVLEKAKLQRFALTGDAPCILPADYSAHKECQYNQQLPANFENKEGISLAYLSDDQITLGSLLTKQDRLMVFNQADSVRHDNYTRKLKLPIFGFHIAFTEEEELSGKFGAEAQSGKLLRCWDFSLPEISRPLWHGYARRYINAYVPCFSESDEWLEDKYGSLKEADDVSEIKLGNPKTFNHLACEERHSEDGQNFIGKIAIATLKGDVDNLGTIFQQGLKEPTFAKMAALSRQMNQFFSLWLPVYCAQNYPNIYTVFAGGDDFFLIGPWLQTQKLAAEMREKFQIYVAENKGITFSAGIAVSKPGLPLRKLSAYAEEALEQAKAYQNACQSKNAVSVYGETLAWSGWKDIMAAQEQISSLKTDYGLSTGYIYAMLEFCDAAQKEKDASTSVDIAVAGMWRSRFSYRTRRYVNMQKNIIGKEAKQNAYNRLTESFYQNGIEKLGSKYRIPLFNHFYLLRAR